MKKMVITNGHFKRQAHVYDMLIKLPPVVRNRVDLVLAELVKEYEEECGAFFLQYSLSMDLVHVDHDLLVNVYGQCPFSGQSVDLSKVISMDYMTYPAKVVFINNDGKVEFYDEIRTYADSIQYLTVGGFSDKSGYCSIVLV